MCVHYIFMCVYTPPKKVKEREKSIQRNAKNSLFTFLLQERVKHLFHIII